MNKALLLLLKNWRDLNEGIGVLREDQVGELLTHELANDKRKVVIERLHQRFTTLRAKRERAELIARIV